MDAQEDYFQFEGIEPQAGPDLSGNDLLEPDRTEPMLAEPPAAMINEVPKTDDLPKTDEMPKTDDAVLIDEDAASMRPAARSTNDSKLDAAATPGFSSSAAADPITNIGTALITSSAASPSETRRADAREQEAPLALYRRYRPDNFADVIGQEHVTEPLMRALTNGKINHAYLFSGPRGCGKTSSARILARCLNCAQGPTATPCGVCQSCVELATGGPGSIDVIEMDAASHGGVNEARDLRERAFFAPVNSRYKIYIIDEAHMVTKEGFNALLKVVEEPPAHVKFIFATTEPEKVIGTIRSRTHHYPFHLVPPKTLSTFLAKICASEGIEVEEGVLSLVTRAGAGSVRDCLSVLDQLLGSAGPEGVQSATAAGLLGFTPDALLDDISDAFGARDAKRVFAAIDRVIEVGQDPRRFAEDLLQRFRDLMIVATVEDAVSSGLLDVAQDQGDRLRTQSSAFEPAELTRAASVLAQGLTDMRGTTSPRLHLELMCARILLPSSLSETLLQQRVENLERSLAGRVDSSPRESRSSAQGSFARARAEEQAGIRVSKATTETQPAAMTTQPPAGESREPGGQQPPTSNPMSVQRQRPVPPVDAVPPQRLASETEPAPRQRPAPTPEPEPAQSQRQRPAPEIEPMQPASSASGRIEPTKRPESGADPSLTLDEIRKYWPAVLDRIKERRRFSWVILSQNVQVFDFHADTLTVEFSNAGARESFTASKSNEVLIEVLADVIGAKLRIASQLAGSSSSPLGGTVADERTDGPAVDPGAEGISVDDEELDDLVDPLELLKAEFAAEVISTDEEN